ncbi:hypothetical protein [Nostoc sp.]
MIYFINGLLGIDFHPSDRNVYDGLHQRQVASLRDAARTLQLKIKNY